MYSKPLWLGVACPIFLSWSARFFRERIWIPLCVHTDTSLHDGNPSPCAISMVFIVKVCWMENSFKLVLKCTRESLNMCVCVCVCFRMNSFRARLSHYVIITSYIICMYKPLGYFKYEKVINLLKALFDTDIVAYGGIVFN